MQVLLFCTGNYYAIGLGLHPYIYAYCYTKKYNVHVLSTSSYLWGTSSVLSLEQYGTHVYNH